MNKLLISLFVMVLALSACALPMPPSTDATYSVASATPALTESATPEIPSNATLEATTCVSDNSTTTFAVRDPLVVNGTKVALQVRDANCPRATYHDETGVATGQQYKVVVPAGWSIAFAAVSCEVVEDGGSPVQYLETPFILIQGPWSGQLGCYEAGVHGLPSEWESYLTSVIKPIHDSEVGHVVPLTIITGN